MDNQFRPGQMRQAGGFSGSEYKTHCSWGGHPNPGARWLLADHQRLVAVELLWADLAQHLTDTWRIVRGALQALGPDEDLLPPNAAEVSEYISSWRTQTRNPGASSCPEDEPPASYEPFVYQRAG